MSSLAAAAADAFGQAPAEVLAGLSGLEHLRAIRDGRLPAAPMAQKLDFALVEVDHGRVVFEGRPSAAFYNPIGTVHGGWAATLLDSCMGCAAHSTLPPGSAYTTLEFKVNLVRAITAATGTVRATGVVLQAGRRIATAEGRLVDAAGRLLAHGTTTCLVLPQAGGSAP
jgi:uncharacterized protein (TIGR00369 family)